MSAMDSDTGGQSIIRGYSLTEANREEATFDGGMID